MFMREKSDVMLPNSDVRGLDLKTDSGNNEKKGFSYYLPVILLAFLAVIVIAEVKYRVLIDELLIRYLLSGKWVPCSGIAL